MPGFPCCCAKGIFDWYANSRGAVNEYSNHLDLIATRVPAGYSLFDFSSALPPYNYTIDLNPDPNVERGHWLGTIADENDRTFSSRHWGVSDAHPYRDAGSAGGAFGDLVWSAAVGDAEYTGLLYANVHSANVYAYLDAAGNFFNSALRYRFDIQLQYISHQWVVVQFFDDVGTLRESWSLDLVNKTGANGGTFDHDDGRTGYFLEFDGGDYNGGQVRVHLTDGPSTLNFTGATGITGNRTRLWYYQYIHSVTPGISAVTDMVIMDVPTGVRHIRYRPPVATHFFTDQFWRYVEGGEREIWFDDNLPIVLEHPGGHNGGFNVVQNFGSPQPVGDIEFYPSLDPSMALWSCGEGKVAFVDLRQAANTKGALSLPSYAHAQVSRIFEFTPEEKKVYAGRVGSGYWLPNEGRPDDPPIPYHVSPHGYPFMFGVLPATSFDSTPGDTPPVGGITELTQTAAITFGRFAVENRCMHLGEPGDTLTPCTVDPDAELPSGYGGNAYNAKFITPGRDIFFERSHTTEFQWEYSGELHATPQIWVGAMHLENVGDYAAGFCVCCKLFRGWAGDGTRRWENEIVVKVDDTEVYSRPFWHRSQLFGYLGDAEVSGMCVLPSRRCVWFKRIWSVEPTSSVPGTPHPTEPWEMQVYEGTTLTWTLRGGYNPITGQTNDYSSGMPACWEGGHEWFYVRGFWLCDDRLEQQYSSVWAFSVDGSVRFPCSNQVDDVNDGLLGYVFSGVTSEGIPKLLSTDCIKKPSELRVGLRKNTWATSECDP